MENTSDKDKEQVAEEAKDFSGNYMQNFEGNISDDTFPGAIISWERYGENILFFYGEKTWLELTVVTDKIIKFRFANEMYFENDFSYAINPEFKPAVPQFDIENNKNEYIISTNKIRCHLEKKTFLIKITDLAGNVIMEDEKGYHWKEERLYGGNVVVSTKKIQDNECFYGLGDKSGPLNLADGRFELWGTDCYGYTEETDPVYKNIPFYMGLHKNIGYGVFMDNSFRSYFDFGQERENVFSFWAQGGEMRYYFIYGPDLQNVSEQYAELTGKPELPPLWALGYQQSKWSYYPEQTVRDLAAKFRELRIPCDAIHLDIDYMDGYRCFTWDQSRFPDPKKMISDLREQGFKIIVIIDPGIKVDLNYYVYQQGMDNNYFCTRSDGPKMKGSVWPGPCHFPDFTHPDVREWWSGLFVDLMDVGVAGVWNDMNEPAVFETGTFPLDVRHDYDGNPCSHRKGHNVYGMQMARATHEGQKKFLGNKRSFTITRSAYSGTQRFASVWTGDNLATWDHLKIANRQCQRLSASGISFAGSDVGGFIGTPSGELYTRWIQLATFHPFFRTHSSGDHGDKEPWVFEKKYTDIVRYFIEFRYQLLPYIYTSFWQNSSFGTPMLKSLYMVDQEDKETYFREEEFVLGDHLLVCPISEEAVTERKVYLPKGTWYNYWTNDRYQGATEHSVVALLNQIPLFVRAGAVVPMQPKMQYTNEFEFDQLDLHIYYGKEETLSYLYEDDGDSYDYRNGKKCLKTFRTFSDVEGFSIKQSSEGDFNTTYNSYVLLIKGYPAKIVKVEVDGKDRTSEVIHRPDTAMIIVPKNFNTITII